MKIAAPCRIETRLPRRPEFVRFARSAAKALALQLDFNYGDSCDVELSVGEACANAVEHVCDVECTEILMSFVIESNHLVIEVCDHGQGFDPAKVESSQEDPARGLGIGLQIIRALMDEVKISSSCQTGTCVRMVKYRESEPDAGE